MAPLQEKRQWLAFCLAEASVCVGDAEEDMKATRGDS